MIVLVKYELIRRPRSVTLTDRSVGQPTRDYTFEAPQTFICKRYIDVPANAKIIDIQKWLTDLEKKDDPTVHYIVIKKASRVTATPLGE